MTPATGRLRIATRRSQLALWQAEHVAALLRARNPRLAVELVPMSTQGDRVQDRTLAQIGGKGLFVRELEAALAEGHADIAVHSLKDVPSDLTPSMRLAAYLTRADARDAFLSLRHASFAALPSGARLGTSSPRRQSQLRALRPDLELLTLRGNVDTRLQRLAEGRFDAILLACAGLDRLGLGAQITQRLDVGTFTPAPGQGIVAIECRADDERSYALCSALNDAVAAECGRAERAFALRLEGSCQSPIAAHATVDADGWLHLHGAVGAPDGNRVYRDGQRGLRADPEGLGSSLAERLLRGGAGPLLETLRSKIREP